ncbi:MAG: lysylphosphatidylglycerol synthase transmembrane domain-containing protein [Acidimicrobiia bacterium]
MALPSVAPPRRHRAWVKWGRIVVSVALLAVLMTKIDPDDLIPPDRSLPGTLAFAISGAALMAFSFVVASWRWQRVLAVYDVHVRLPTLLKHYLAGQFVGNALPSTVGGDVLRISRSSKDIGSTEIAFASVVLERLTGFVALPLITALGFAIRPDLLEVPRAWVALAIAGGTLAALCIILWLSAHPRLAGRFVHSESWTRYIGIVHVGVDRFRRDPRDTTWALVLSVFYQITVVSAVYCAVHTIGLTIPNAAVLAFVPAVAAVQVLPVSVGGLGVREAMLAFLLHPLGVPTGQAVAVGLLWYAMTLVVSLIGAPAFAMGHDADEPVPPSTDPPEPDRSAAST